jgi:hypothetical protein
MQSVTLVAVLLLAESHFVRTTHASSCCEERCIKRALVAEAEGGAAAVDAVAKECCSGCASGQSIDLPGRCLEVNGGMPEEHRNVDIWDCHDYIYAQRWQWVGEGAARALKNAYTGKCLHVYSYDAPARLEQSSSCSTRWAAPHAGSGVLVEAATGLCLIVNGTVVGKDKDVNYSVPEWVNSTDKTWISYAGKDNGARVTLADCAAAARAGDGREIWSVVHNDASASSFGLRSGVAGSWAVVGGNGSSGVGSTCGGARSTQTCSGPPPLDLAAPNRSHWPSWLVANRAATASDVASELAGSPRPHPAHDPYTQLGWLKTSFVETQMMVHDRYFYDVANATYTVDRYLDDLIRRFGGIDAVLLWYPYPNLGIGTASQLERRPRARACCARSIRRHTRAHAPLPARAACADWPHARAPPSTRCQHAYACVCVRYACGCAPPTPVFVQTTAANSICSRACRAGSRACAAPSPTSIAAACASTSRSPRGTPPSAL